LQGYEVICMLENIPEDHPLRKLFQSAVDRAFVEHKELYSPEVASHIGENVLADFLHVDRLYRLRNAEGRRLEELPEMIHVAQEKEGPERRLEVERYIGDFVLFMGGFFPGSLRRRRWFTPDPMVAKVGGILVSFSQPLDYYIAEGRNAYARAANIARFVDPESQATFALLGKHLERYLGLLGLVKTLLHQDPQFKKIEGIIS
jgi:hypothetical protein